VIVLRLCSKLSVACGLVVSSGFHGAVLKLSGLTSKASCGLTRFCVRKGLLEVVDLRGFGAT